ncbi:V-type ATP synthase subunit I [Oscillospiraceae bacterium N12]|jgi:V/A-type H+-transporting ATPase subunit I|uniref:V-type ATP synthase subunit I n=1 Tax=Jilunia laotingensis TaxID=2763675 RepID=A0A926F8Q6_9BACT|nr:V-type ATPase 116kDa subunit family protein [Jilunia laotingensis]MBC8594142.1 V-type ATP synthase subunit I [Jilunia laotingensis]
MITKMKKLTFLVYHKEYENFLNSLRELGVVHIVEKQQGAAENAELQENVRLSSRLAATLKLLQNVKLEKGTVALKDGGTPDRGMKVLDEVDALQAEKNRLTQQLQIYTKEREALQAWGDFDPDSLQRLKDAGYVIGFYTCSEGNYKEEWETEYNAMIISHISSKIYFITVTKADVEVDLDVEQAKLPVYSLTRVEQLHSETKQAILENEQKLAALAEKDIPSLKEALKELQNNIEFSKVVLSTEQAAGEKLMLLEGWAPARNKLEIEAFLDSSHVYYEISDPAPDDNVPIELNNKGFFSWFEPICKLYMLPKYNELDLTPFFAPFFMIFFGLCLGDSGYGLLLFVGATAYRLMAKKLTPSTKSIISLIQVLATSTFFCGLLTGTFFGANIYDLDWPIVQRLKHAVLLDNNDMFQLSLILGAIQIIFGMVLKAVNQTIQFGFKYAIATIGWIILLLSMAISALLPKVMPMGGTVHLVILAISGVMIFLFNSPGKNIFLNIGLGLWDTYNMVTGLLGDVLSYVRLFALGLSGGILAGVFNSLAKGMSPDNVILGPIVMVLIFLIGHAINIFMNVLGAMVHPMRLTFVEFFKNSGYEGGGKEYKPFKK